MGLSGISIRQLLIVLAIILLLFGTKKLRNLGGDLGTAVKGFKKAVNDDQNQESKQQDPKQGETYENEAANTDNNKTN